MIFVDTSQTIEHHGVKGQKWGIRRFQNKDGSLTAAGKKRSSSGQKSAQKKNKQAPKKASVSSSSRQSSSEMDYDDLKRAVDRLKLEKDYKTLYSELHPKQVSTGKKIAEAFVSKILAPSLEEIGKEMTKKAIRSALDQQSSKDKDKKNK